MTFQADNPLRGDVWLIQTRADRLLSENADFFSQVTMEIEPWCRRHKLQNRAVCVQEGIGWRRLIP